MLGHLYENQECSAAATLELVGERWSLLILRDAMFGGCTRFSQFQKRLGIATNVLAKRLDGFVAAGLMERRGGSAGSPGEYLITRKGSELKPVIISLTEWGDKWLKPGPVVFTSRSDGVAVGLGLRRVGDDTPVDVADVIARRREVEHHAVKGVLMVDPNQGSHDDRAPHDERAAVVLRPAIAADADAIARIWREGWADAHLGHVPDALVAARTPGSFSERAREGLEDTIVATRADAVAGFVILDADQVDQLYLDRAARGAGIGAALLDAAEQAVIAAGHRRAWLAVATGNEVARRFYERRGWVDDGPFIHEAPVPGGSVAVDCHRFVSPERSAPERAGRATRC